MTEEQKKELIAGFGFVAFDNDLKNKPPPENWKPMQEHEFSKESLEVYRIVQARKTQKIKLTKTETYDFLKLIVKI
jgi:hypothetical protein